LKDEGNPQKIIVVCCVHQETSQTAFRKYLKEKTPASVHSSTQNSSAEHQQKMQIRSSKFPLLFFSSSLEKPEKP
jgi:hypothetical protein